jgi:asparagine synthetase B (glutamine-hydrolysing)
MAYNIPRPQTIVQPSYLGGAAPLAQGLSQGMQLAGLAQQSDAREQQIQLQKMQLEQARQQMTEAQAKDALANIAQGAEDALELQTGEARRDYLTNRLSNLISQGKSTEQTEEAIDIGLRYGFDSPEMTGALQEGLKTANSFGVFTPRQALEREQAAKLAAQEAKEIGDIRKETRGSIRKSVGTIAKQASVLDENYGKLNNLVGEIKKGNRSAVSQALVSLVKLGDPGSIVKESEMEAALNAENPIAALQSKGVDTSVIDSVLRKIDPLNPESINTDELLATARAQMAANVPSIQGQYEEQKSLASENLTDKGIKSLFPKGLDSRIGALSKFTIQEDAGVDEPDMTGFVLMEDANGNRAMVNPNTGEVREL